MGSEWRTTTLGEIVGEGNGLIQTGPFGSQLHASDYVSEGIPVIMPANIIDNRVNLTDIARIREKDANRLSKHIVRKGDIVYSRRGDVTRKALITNSEVGMFCGTGCLLIRPGSKIDPRFLTYHLSSPENQEWIIRHAVGATMPNLNTGILSEVPLKMPDQTLQKAIAHILGSLDDKIELNRRMNATLEAMAQALFKSWFVDFGPVIDNALAAGNPIPGPLRERAEVRRALGNRCKPLPPMLQQHFSNRFRYSEQLGWVPVGWNELPFRKFTTEVTTKVGARNVPEYSSTNNGLVPRSEMFRKRLSKDKSRNKLIQSGDIIFGMSRETLNFGVMYDPAGSVSSAYKVFHIDDSVIYPKFVEQYMRMREHIYYNVLGSSSREGQSLSKGSFLSTTMLIPPKDIQNGFQDIVDFVAKIEQLKKESQTLANLRDTLLPQLLSGDLHIPDAEKLLQGAP